MAIRNSFDPLAVRVAARAKAAAQAEIPPTCSLSEAATLLGCQRGTVGDLVARMGLPTTKLPYSALGRQLERAELELIRFTLTPQGGKAVIDAFEAAKAAGDAAPEEAADESTEVAPTLSVNQMRLALFEERADKAAAAAAAESTAITPTPTILRRDPVAERAYKASRDAKSGERAIRAAKAAFKADAAE